MAARELVEYLIKVTTDAKGAKSGLAGLVSEAKAASVGIGAVVAGFAAAGAGAVALANDLTDAVDRINTLATNSGLAAETIKGLDALAASTGKDLKNLIPKDLPKRIADAAKGTGPVAEGLEAMGISAIDANGALRSSDAVLRDVIDGLGRVEDPTTKAAIATQVFGARSQELTSALADSGDLEAWIGYAESYGTDVGPEAVRITAKWQQSMAIFNQGVLATKNGLMPLVDILASTVTGLTAMAVFAANAAGALAKLKNPFQVLKAGFDGVKGWAGAVKTLNTELGTTARKLDAAAEAAAKLTGIFEAGDAGTNAMLIGFTSRNRKGKGGGDDPPKGSGSGKAKTPEEDVPGVDAEEFRRLEQAIVDEAATRKEAAAKEQEVITAAAATLLDGMSSFETTVGDVVASETDTMQDGFSALSLTMGTVVDLASIVGASASMIEDVTAAIVSLPEQLVALPEAVTGLIDGLAGLVPALIEAAPEIALAMGEAMFAVAFAHVDVVATALGAVFEQLPGDIAQAIAEALKGLTGDLNPFNGDGALGGAIGSIAERVPFFEEGGHVTRTGLAYLHENETVVPAVDSVRTSPTLGGMNVQMVTPDPRMAAQDLSAALGPYGIGLALGGAR